MSIRLVVDMNLSTEWVDELQQHEAALAAGALVVVDPKKSRVRVLPLNSP